MGGWCYWLNGHEFEQTLGDTEGQGSLACCGLWYHRVGHSKATNTNKASCFWKQPLLCGHESARSLQLCPVGCDPMDCSPPSSSVHGSLQARALEWVALPFSRGSSQPRDQTWVSRTAGRFFTIWATRKALEENKNAFFFLPFPSLFISNSPQNTLASWDRLFSHLLPCPSHCWDLSDKMCEPFTHSSFSPGLCLAYPLPHLVLILHLQTACPWERVFVIQSQPKPLLLASGKHRLYRSENGLSIQIKFPLSLLQAVWCKPVGSPKVQKCLCRVALMIKPNCYTHLVVVV